MNGDDKLEGILTRLQLRRETVKDFTYIASDTSVDRPKARLVTSLAYTTTDKLEWR